MLPGLGGRVSIIEEVVIIAIVAQTIIWLDSPVGFIVASFISFTNVAECFPAEDSRYFETARQRASSGFGIATLSVQLLHASILLRPPADDDTQSVSSSSEQIHLGFTYASTLCFAITQIMFSALFSGIFVPLAISFALLLLPAVISAQVFGVLEVYEFDDNVEVAIFVFFIMTLLHMLQTTLKQSFTIGESYLVASVIMSAFYSAWCYSGEVTSDVASIFICLGCSAACATALILYTGHSTRIERNSSPHLTKADVKLSIVFHASCVLCPILSTIIHVLLELNTPPPLTMLFTRFLNAILDPNHLVLLLWGISLLVLAFNLAVNHSPKKEMTTQKRKVFHLIAVMLFFPALFVNFSNIGIVSFGVFWLLLWLSIYSSYQIYPYGGYCRRICASITDYRDSGKLVLTPVYLLFGLAAPIWLDLLRFGKLRLSSFAGLVSVGVGDSMASIIGKKYGRNYWFRDGKSLEGAAGNFVSQLACLSVMRLFVNSGDIKPVDLISCSFLSALLEASTDQIDNFILPLISYSMLSLAMEPSQQVQVIVN